MQIYWHKHFYATHPHYTSVSLHVRFQGALDLLLADVWKEKWIFAWRLKSKKKALPIQSTLLWESQLWLQLAFSGISFLFPFRNVCSRYVLDPDQMVLAIRSIKFRLWLCDQYKDRVDPIPAATRSSHRWFSFWSLKASTCTPVSRINSRRNSFTLSVLLPIVQSLYNPVSSDPFRFSLVHNTTAFNISFSIDRIYHQNGVAYDYYSQLDLGLTQSFSSMEHLATTGPNSQWTLALLRLLSSSCRCDLSDDRSQSHRTASSTQKCVSPPRHLSRFCPVETEMEQNHLQPPIEPRSRLSTTQSQRQASRSLTLLFFFFFRDRSSPF